MRWVLLAGLMSAFLAAPAWAVPTVRTTLGIVEAGGEDYGRFWFDFVRLDQRFTFDPAKFHADDLLKALKDSAMTGRSVSVHYFVDGASFPAGSVKPVFVVQSITYDGHTYQTVETPPSDVTVAGTPPRDRAAAQLAKGIALAGDAETGEARAALTAAIASGALEPTLQALALKTRAQLDEGDAMAGQPPGDARDKLLVAALADAKAWHALMPADFEAASEVAQDLRDLGAYDEAIAIYRDVIARWPNQSFWPQIRVASIYRTIGRYDASLAELDALAKSGDGTGMGYHYHRGWTFNEMGRYDDAIAEFNEGFKNQPDFAGAYMRRACALGQTGKLKDALADQQQAVKLIAQYDSEGGRNAALKNDMARSAEIEKSLQTMVARDPAAKTDVACKGYWRGEEDKRERSALLPPAKS